MKHGASARVCWAWVAGLTVFIYASLPVAPALWTGMDKRAPLLLRGGLAALALLAAGALWRIVWKDKGERRPLPILALAAVTVLFAVGFISPAFPSERLHFLEYGLLGMLVLRASLKSRPRSLRAAFGLAALVLCTLGTIDELIQYILPNRFFDWRDIWFNIAGGLLGFGAYLVLSPPGSAV